MKRLLLCILVLLVLMGLVSAGEVKLIKSIVKYDDTVIAGELLNMSLMTNVSNETFTYIVSMPDDFKVTYGSVKVKCNKNVSYVLSSNQIFIKSNGREKGSVSCTISIKVPRDCSGTYKINISGTVGSNVALSKTIKVKVVPFSKYGIELKCPDNHHVILDPVKGTTYYIKVTNVGSVRDTIILKAFPEIGIEGNMLGKVVPNKVSLDPSKSTIVKLIVKGDSFTKPGKYVVKVTAVSKSNPKVKASIKTVTTVIGAKLDILSPTKRKPANAGFYKKPRSIDITVKLSIYSSNHPIYITKDKLPDIKFFKVYVGKREAKVKMVIPVIPIIKENNALPLASLYKLVVDPPVQDKSGYYDLTVKLLLKLWNTSYEISDTEGRAVYYTKIPIPPPTTPIVTPPPTPTPTPTPAPPVVPIVKIPHMTVILWNGTYTTPIMIAGVRNISGLHLNVAFDPTIVKIVDVKVNKSVDGSSVYYVIGNNSVGVVLINTNGITILKPMGVVDILFKTVKVGFTYIKVTLAEFSDENFNPFKPLVVINGSIRVTIRGDFNGNGRIDIGDVARVAYMVVGKIKQDPRADFNGNGRVDIGDVAKIAYHLLGKVEEL